MKRSLFECFAITFTAFTKQYSHKSVCDLKGCFQKSKTKQFCINFFQNSVQGLFFFPLQKLCSFSDFFLYNSLCYSRINFCEVILRNMFESQRKSQNEPV